MNTKMKKETIAVFPGSFDPITSGHLDIIKRAALLFDKLTVLICVNSEKKYMLDETARKELAKDAVSGIDNVDVEIYNGLFAQYCIEHGINAVVKGLRNEKDFLYEEELLGYNNRIFELKNAKMPETLFLKSDPKYDNCSSTFVRELAKYNIDFGDTVPNASLLKKYLS